MGCASFMVTIRYGDSRYPTAHFFGERDLAKRFYESMKELYDDAEGYTACVQLWTLDSDYCKWILTAFN